MIKQIQGHEAYCPNTSFKETNSEFRKVSITNEIIEEKCPELKKVLSIEQAHKVSV